ncbi:MAG: ABC transporter permease [Clostridium sp.]|uniref:ABC transporter permease n=1 Tax=Clostridium sp. TaxID=1506 RepID=UPI00290B6801|nr:ABC transporter permease [Clostridium sp.]MDU5111254.1 ABC transporter permease [Clostridium sp.]
MLMNLIKNEFTKGKRNLVILFVLAVPIGVAILLCVDFLIRYESWLLPQSIEKGLTSWQVLIKEQRILYFNDYMPMFSALILSTLFESEYRNNSWTFLLTKPIKRRDVLLSKYIVASFYSVVMLILNVISLIVVGVIFKFKEPIPYKFFTIMFFVQLISSLVIMLIHLFLNIKNKNLLVSIGIAAVLSIVSTNIYHNDYFIKYFNPYGFSLFSITQGKNELLTLFIISVLILFIVPKSITRYFNNKEIY